MATLHMSDRNGQDGIIGIMAEEQYREFREMDEERMEAGEIDWPRPIFYFAPEDHELYMHLTGSLEMMKRLVAGHSVEPAWFAAPKDPGAARRAKPTRQQVIDVFGVDPETLN